MSSQEIKKIRPSLKTIAPLSAWNIRAFGLLNAFVLGLGLYLIAPDIQSFKAVGTLPVRSWSVVFLLHGLILLSLLRANNWQLMKGTLLAGCFLNSVWVLQFISMSILKPRPLILVLMGTGIMLLYLQAGTYINFTPKYNVKR